MDPKDSGERSESKAVLSASPKAGRGANRPRNRHLIRWDPDKIELAFHALHWAAAKQGVNLPWDEAAKIVDDQTTGDALKQQLIKRRNKRVELGLKAPPPLPGRGRSTPMPRRSILKSTSGLGMAKPSDITSSKGEPSKRKGGRPAKSSLTLPVKTGKVTKPINKSSRRSKRIAAKRELSETEEEEATPELGSDSDSGKVYGRRKKIVRFRSPSPELDEEMEGAVDSEVDAEGDDDDETPTKVKKGKYDFSKSYNLNPDWTDELVKGEHPATQSPDTQSPDTRRNSRILRLPIRGEQLRAFDNQDAPYLAQARAFTAGRPVPDPGQGESNIDATAMQDQISKGVSLQRLLRDPPTTPRRSRSSNQARLHTQVVEPEPEASTVENQTSKRSTGRDNRQEETSAATEPNSTPRSAVRQSQREPASGAVSSVASSTAYNIARRVYREQADGMLRDGWQRHEDGKVWCEALKAWVWPAHRAAFESARRDAEHGSINEPGLRAGGRGGNAPVARMVPAYPLVSATSIGDMPYSAAVDRYYNPVQEVEYRPFFDLGGNRMSFDPSNPFNHQASQGLQGFNGDVFHSNDFENSNFWDLDSIGASTAAPVSLPSQSDPFAQQTFDLGIPQGMIPSTQTSFNIPQTPFAQQNPFAGAYYFPQANPFAQHNPFIFAQQDPFMEQYDLGFPSAGMSAAAPAFVPSQHSPFLPHDLSFSPINLDVPASAILPSQHSPVAEQQSLGLNDAVSMQQGQFSLTFPSETDLETTQEAIAAQRIAQTEPPSAEANESLTAQNGAMNPQLPTTLGDNLQYATLGDVMDDPTLLEQIVTTIDANDDVAQLPSLACSDLVNPDNEFPDFLNLDFELE